MPRISAGVFRIPSASPDQSVARPDLPFVRARTRAHVRELLCLRYLR